MKDIDFIERLVDVVARSPIEELEIEKVGWRVRITKAGTQQRPASPGPASDPATANMPGAGASFGQHEVRAPLTGVFFRSVAEGEAPLVAVGDLVEEGQQIGLLEAMKTFNPVEADCAGRIVEIRFDDRSSVDAGCVLFVLEYPD